MISQQKSIETALQESETKFRAIFEQAAVGMALVTRDGNFLQLNQKLCEITGYPEAELLCLSLYDLTHPDDLMICEACQAKVDQILEEHLNSFEVEKRYLRKNGQIQWIKMTVSLIRDLQKTPQHFLIVIEDIQNRNQTEEQLLAQRQELARSNQDLEQFAHLVSHDLQAPLATIVSYAQLLEKYYQPQLDDKAHKYLAKIIDGTRRMSQQINDLLAYSRVSTQKQSLQVIDLNEILQEAIANLQYIIKKNQATIHINDPLPTLKADPSQFIQLLQNLICNAIKYRKAANPEIYIKVIRKKDSWLFSISDNGIGIKPKNHKKIFQIFQRLHTQQEYPGTGIGLAICQRIVHRYQGTIWVESELGQGSTFYFKIADL